MEFLCGWRALADYQIKNRLVNSIASNLSVGYWELGNAIERLRLEIKTLRSDLRKADELLLEYKARELIQFADRDGGLKVMSKVFEDADLKQLGTLGVDLVWAPTADEMYPGGFSTGVKPGSAVDGLETDFRPHFFGGVATVVAKLFNQVRPDFAQTYVNLGAALAGQERFEEAESVLLQASRLLPRSTTVHKNLGLVYWSLGKKEQAKQEHELLKALDEKAAAELLRLFNSPEADDN